VSIPGVDVLTAGYSQLQFTSDFSSLSLFTQGYHSLSWSSGGISADSVAFIPFGKTFASPPLVWFYQYMGSYLLPLGSAYGVSYAIRDNSLVGQPRDFYVSCTVLTNGIDIRAYYNRQTAGWPQPNMTIAYYVFEYNL
jgi:hypothetical protein